MANVVETTPNTNTVTVTEENRTVSVTDTSTNVVSVNNLVVPSGAGAAATGITLTATGSVSSTNVQGAIAELARQQYSQDTAPTDVEAGTFWYETDTENLFVYREISPNVYNWVAVILGEEDSDILDGGSY